MTRKLVDRLASLPPWKRVVVAIGVAIGATVIIYYGMTKPTHDGPWKPEYAHVASAQIAAETVTINNFRRARYTSSGADNRIDWLSRSVDLANLQEVWFGISVFASPGIAHTFLSFDFGDGDPVVVSVEARQRPGQSYGPITGALRRFHLTYVFADERDIVGVRTHSRRNDVFYQPLSITPDRARTLFLDMVERANALAAQPEFYNTFTTNCTNSLLEETDVPAWRRYFDWRILLPGYSDRVAYEYAILDRRHALADLRAAAFLDPKDFASDDADFYTQIRSGYYQRLSKKSKSPR